MERSIRHLAHGLLGIVALFIASSALADPPSRVARLSYITGRISFAPAAETETWVQARLNRPLYIGDRLWADSGARAELELGTATLRLAPRTSVTVLNIDDRTTQLQLAEGRLNVRVRALQRDETFEIDTPNLAFVVTSPGTYRVEVDASGDATVVAVREGRGEVYGEGASYLVNTGQRYKFYGTDLDNDYARVTAPDEFDRWVQTRDARYDRSVSARYVSRGTIGFSDLDDYGNWNTVADYGAVWYPRTVPAGWAPYRDGHWSWINPWGWTWVDDAPWGFAPFHYGRWALISERWGWVPGPVNVRPVYAPALVAFVGGNDFTVSVASGGTTRGIGWFPLAPGEVYRPAYRVSQDYFTQINVTNTRVNTTYVTNVYNAPPAAAEVRYRNRATAAAITAVPVAAFVESRPVARAVIPAASQTVQAAPVIAMPTVAPQRASIVGAAPPAQVQPPRAAEQRQVVARTAPPAAVPVFTAHDSNATPPTSGAANPAQAPQGTPARLREHVRVVAPSQPTQSGATAEHRGAPAGTPSAAAAPGGAPGAPPAAPPRATTPSAPAAEASPNEGRRGRPDRTAAPGATPPPAATAGAPNTPPVAAPPIPPAAPAATAATPDAAAPNANRGRGRPDPTDRTAAPGPLNAPGAPGNTTSAPNATAPNQAGGPGTPGSARGPEAAPAANMATPAAPPPSQRAEQQRAEQQRAEQQRAEQQRNEQQRVDQQRGRDRQQEGPGNAGRRNNERPASAPVAPPAAVPITPAAVPPAPPAAAAVAPPAAAPEPRGRGNGRRGDAPGRPEPAPGAQPPAPPAPAPAPAPPPAAAARPQPVPAAPGAAAPPPAAGAQAPPPGEGERAAARRKQQEERDKAKQDKEANPKKE